MYAYTHLKFNVMLILLTVKEESTLYIGTKWEEERSEESPERSGIKCELFTKLQYNHINGLEEPNQILHNASN